VRKLAFVWLLLWPQSALAQSSIDAIRPLVEVRFPEVQWVDAPTLRRWVGSDREVVLIDARASAEYRVSHLAEAQRVDPDAVDVRRLRRFRGRRVVVYCSVGWRSANVADQLRRAGFSDVYNLEGGIFDWANRGYPVERAGVAVRAVHPFDETWGRMLNAGLRSYRPDPPAPRPESRAEP